MLTLSMLLQNSIMYLSDALKREEGQDFGEYAFLFGIIVLGVAAALTALAGGLNGLFAAVTAALGTMAAAA